MTLNEKLSKDTLFKILKYLKKIKKLKYLKCSKYMYENG